MNAATMSVGLIVAVVLILASYFSIKYLRSGKCDGCKGCDKGKKG